jgi:hypothetical protein
MKTKHTTTTTRRPAFAAGASLAVAALLALTGCSSATEAAPSDSPASNAGSGSGTSAAPAARGRADARMVACLQAAGFDATIHTDGWVVARYDVQIPEGQDVTIPEGFDGAWRDRDGNTWVAPQSPDSFETDPELGEAWANCEIQVPDFEQITWNDVEDSRILSDPQEGNASALEFAQRARDAGYEWMADPTPWAWGFNVLQIPSWVTEQEFIAMLQDAFDPDNPVRDALITGDVSFNMQEVLLRELGPQAGGFLPLPAWIAQQFAGS